MSDLPDNARRFRHYWNIVEKTPQDCIAYFEEVANVYEDDTARNGRTMCKSITKLLLKVMADGKYGIEKTAKILDVGSGTGLLGERLRAKGFDGQIDAVDGSSAMLEIAKTKKGVYERTFCHIIEPVKKMPEELTKEDYDIVICSGSIASHLIHYESIQQLLKALKTGGVILFSLVRRIGTISFLEFNIGFAREKFKLESEGIWKLVDLQFNPRIFTIPEQVVDGIKEATATDFCYVKLKSM